MDEQEFYYGIIVVSICFLVMAFSIYKIWKYEEENPTENIARRD